MRVPVLFIAASTSLLLVTQISLQPQDSSNSISRFGNISSGHVFGSIYDNVEIVITLSIVALETEERENESVESPSGVRYSLYIFNRGLKDEIVDVTSLEAAIPGNTYCRMQRTIRAFHHLFFSRRQRVCKGS